MEDLWLVLDCNYLCHRAGHIFRQLNHQGEATGVIYGFMRDVMFLQADFATTQLAFCFDPDGACGRRLEILPGYKSSRLKAASKASEAEKEQKAAMRVQMRKLRDVILPGLGYKNVFHTSGFESDDIIASIVRGHPDKSFVIVSSDSDLLQLLDKKRVTIWSPLLKVMTTQKSFVKEWGLDPSQWNRVKAIAGCGTDDVPGVRGVGDKTAAKYLCGTLPPERQTYKDIVAQKKQWRRNLPVVTLPIEGTPSYKLRTDHVDEAALRKLYRKYGIESL